MKGYKSLIKALRALQDEEELKRSKEEEAKRKAALAREKTLREFRDTILKYVPISEIEEFDPEFVSRSGDIPYLVLRIDSKVFNSVIEITKSTSQGVQLSVETRTYNPERRDAPVEKTTYKALSSVITKRLGWIISLNPSLRQLIEGKAEEAEASLTHSQVRAEAEELS